MLSEESNGIIDFNFIWFTDGLGWYTAKNNLKETFDSMEHIYNINDMRNGIIKEILK